MEDGTRICHKGQARSDRNHQVQTRVFDPNLVLLATEYVPDSLTRDATQIVFDFTPDPSCKTERAILKYIDDGHGKAELERMISPSTENGEGVSRYAKGHTFVRNRLDDGTFPWAIESKVSGETMLRVCLRGPLKKEGMEIINPCPKIGQPGTSFSKIEESGYRETIGVIYDRFPIAHKEGRPEDVKDDEPLPRMGDAHYWKNIRDSLEEILRVRLDPDLLSKAKITIKTQDINGKSEETVVRTTTLIKVLRTSKDVVLIHEESRDMGAYRAEEQYFYIKRKTGEKLPIDKTLAEQFPHYITGMCALFGLENNIVTDMTLSDAYKVPEHQSSHVNRIVYVNFVKKETSTSINLLPNPATIKLGFEGPIYEKFLEIFRKNKPKEFMSPDVKKRIQSEIDAPSEAKVATIPTHADTRVDLPKWILELIGLESLTMTRDVEKGIHKFTYIRRICDIHKQANGLAIAVNHFRRINRVPLGKIDIAWYVAKSNEDSVNAILSYLRAEEHAVLQCARVVVGANI